MQAELVDPVLDFTRYMGHLMPAGAFTRLLSPSKTDKESGTAMRLPFTGSIICDSQLYWLNALIGRCFYDFLRDALWADRVKDKLQRKLSKIHVSCVAVNDLMDVTFMLLCLVEGWVLHVRVLLLNQGAFGGVFFRLLFLHPRCWSFNANCNTLKLSTS